MSVSYLHRFNNHVIDRALWLELHSVDNVVFVPWPQWTDLNRPSPMSYSDFVGKYWDAEDWTRYDGELQ